MWTFVEKPKEKPPAQSKAKGKQSLQHSVHVVVPHQKADRLENLFLERKAPASQQLGLMHGKPTMQIPEIIANIS
jgi:hypothetical protein